MTGLNSQDLTNLDDSSLVALARQNNQEAFGVLYERNVKKIYSHIYYRTGNHQNAEDLTARVFHRALAHISKYEDRGSPFSAWLYTIANNLLANFHRDSARHKVVALDDYVAGLKADSPEASAEHNDEVERLLAAIRNLPEDRQQLLVLKALDELPNQEIGRMMGRSEGAIKSLFHRTLSALREELTAQNTQPQSARRKRH